MFGYNEIEISNKIITTIRFNYIIDRNVSRKEFDSNSFNYLTFRNIATQDFISTDKRLLYLVSGQHIKMSIHEQTDMIIIINYNRNYVKHMFAIRF